MNNLVTGSLDALVQQWDEKRLTATVFAYESPATLDKPKGIARLCRSDIVYSSVHLTLRQAQGERTQGPSTKQLMSSPADRQVGRPHTVPFVLSLSKHQ